MKKILILTIVLAVLVTAISVCSVSADDGQYITFRPNLDFDTPNASYLYEYSDPEYDFSTFDWMDNSVQIFNYHRVDPTDYDGEWATFDFDPTEKYNNRAGLVMPFGVSTFTDNNTPVNMTPNDILFLDEGRFYIEVETELTALIKARFTIRPVYSITGSGSSTFSTVYAYTDTIDIYIAEGSKRYFDYPRLDFNYTDFFEDGISTPAILCVEFIFSTADPFEITILNLETSVAKVFFGKGTSPNNPIYPPADGGNVGNLDDAEQELIGSQQQGLDNTGTVIGNAENVLVDLNTDLQLGAFVVALNPILDKITTIAGVEALVNMSLALGLFASLLSLSASIIGAGDRRETARKQRENRTNYLNRKSGNK